MSGSSITTPLARSTLTGGEGITVTNPKGIGGQPTFGYNGLNTIWIPAAAMIPSASGGCAPLSVIATAAADLPDIATLNFDSVTQEYAQFSIRMPKSWNRSSVSVQFVWSHVDTVDDFGVAFSIQGVSIADTDPISLFSGGGTSVDTGGTWDSIYISPAASLSVTGTPAVGEVQFFRVSRVVGDAGDTLAVDARLHGVLMFWTRTTADDT